MKNIKDILSHYTQEPPAGSWERLSQRLDLVAPTAGSSATSQATASGAAKGGAFTLSKVLLSIGATLLTAAAVTTAVIVAHHNRVTEETAQPITEQTTTTAQTATEPTIVETVSIQSQQTAQPNTEPITPTEQTPAQQATEQTVQPLPTKSTATTAETVTPSQQATPQTSTPQPATAKTAVTRPAVTSPVIASVTLPQSTIARQQQQDPALQNLNTEEMDWQQPSIIEIPNVFTPNGDGYNDLFVILGIENCVKRELNVYDRNGRAVYRNRSYENTWNGDNCPDGTYTYKFLYSQNGIEQELRGTVTIIRK